MMKVLKNVLRNAGARPLGWACAALLFLAVAVSRAGAGVPDEARAGAKLFSDSSYKEAADAFRQATIAAPDDVRWRYDLGLSEALGKDYENALNTLGATTKQAPPEVAGASIYNTGNVHLAMGHYKEAAGAYRQALVRNPGDVDAKHNLELALKKLQQQQQQQKDKSGSQNDSTQNEKQKNQDSKDQDKKKQDQKQKDQKQKDKDKQDQQKSEQKGPQDSSGQEPPPDPGAQPQTDSTLTRDQAERILRALADQEARLRDQTKKTMAIPAPGGKDW